jgi:hypothetical protein
MDLNFRSLLRGRFAAAAGAARTLSFSSKCKRCASLELVVDRRSSLPGDPWEVSVVKMHAGVLNTWAARARARREAARHDENGRGVPGIADFRTLQR